MTVGVARQHAGITGQIENCQPVVFCASVTARAHTLSGFRLYLPKPWCADRRRRERARVPESTVFATKTEQGTEMITEAVAGGVPFGRVAADETSDAVKLSSCDGACRLGGRGEGGGFVVVLACEQAVVEAAEEPAEEVALGGGVAVAVLLAAVVVGSGAG